MAKKNKTETVEEAVTPTERPDVSRIIADGALIFWIVFCAFMLLALVSFSSADPGWSHTGLREGVQNSGGPLGAWIADVLFSLFGVMAFLFPILLAIRAAQVLRNHYSALPRQFDVVMFVIRVFGFLVVMVSATSLMAIQYPDMATDYPQGSGGLLGHEIGEVSLALLNKAGSSLILIAAVLFGLTIFTNISWIKFIDWLGHQTFALIDLIRAKIEERKQAKQEQAIAESALKEREEVVRKKRETFEERKAPTIQIPPAKPKPSERVMKEKQGNLFKTEPVTGELPAISLLEPGVVDSTAGYSPESLEHMSRLLESKLEDFGIQAEVVEVMPGPVVTRFEIQPAAGVKVSRITNLAKDLARSMAVISVRVVEVIQGKSVVGIEIPNEKRQMVRLSEVIASEEYERTKSPLALALGHDIAGQPVIADLAKMPHLLVAGTTGSGKSVGINSMLISLLYKSTPEEVRLILVDPKMLELSVYDDIPHLLTPVVTDMKDAANALRWCVGEMERRYKLMAAMGVRNIGGFNKKVKEANAAGEPIVDPIWRPDPNEAWRYEESGMEPTAPNLETLPYIVVVIDEFADMMMIVGKKVEQLIARIAQKARAAGIHLILATQRPSVDVITGLIKANVPTRMAFQVSSKIDSRTILDQGGAEQLLGHGDMLYLPPGTSVSVRVHGAFVDDHEVHNVVNDWKARGKPSYIDEIIDETVASAIAVPGYSSSEEGEDDPESDPLYDEAVAFVLESRKASISSVQRKLRIGYNRAARLVEQMEAAGVVSAMQSNGNREVLAPNSRGD